MKVKLYLISTFFALISLSLFLILWMTRLDGKIRSRLEQGWFEAPIEYYSAPEIIHPGEILALQQVVAQLRSVGLKQTPANRSILEGEMALWDSSQCLSQLDQPELMNVEQCFAFWLKDERIQVIALDSAGKILGIFGDTPLVVKSEVHLPPLLFAQYYGNSPIMRHVLELGDVPLQCLLSVTAIEDADFLQHRGVSVTGTLRASLRNVLKARWAEGGSTITQQLVKNYFLTPKKTITRKLTEQAMALLLEWRVNKDDILQAYLNVIYMGQQGPFEIRGLSSASQHYFAKNIEELNLPECALLAAIINSPGRYSPFTASERALQRRNLVLDKMLERKLINGTEAQTAKQAPLPKPPQRLLTEPAPYFVSAIQKWLEQQTFAREEGLKIYTTLNISAQEHAQQLLTAGLQAIEDNNKKVKEIAQSGKVLQGALIAVDLQNASVTALVGGREFKRTQFNRIMDAHRQVGSIMKPFVFGAALEGTTPEGQNYSPLTPLEDVPFTLKFDRQMWSPKNYDGKNYGSVPMFYALKESLNIATAKLATQIDLDNVVDYAQRAGITAELKPLPSLALGAFEVTPFEVAQAYATLARFGVNSDLRLISKITNIGDEVLWESHTDSKPVIAPEVVAPLVGMMKQTLLSGTARSVRAHGFNMIAAGKTGTTSETKDSWFAGFTPNVLAVVWVGYDDNTPSGLTGASGALPIWARFMTGYAGRFADEDFIWPEGVSHYVLGHDELVDMLPTEDDHIPDAVDLIIRN